jgi:hypothetical protein
MSYSRGDLLGFLSAVFIVVLYAAVLWRVDRNYPVSYHHTDDDYTQHALAHGLSSEAYWRGEPAGKRDWFQLMHPGVPFQLVSWVGLRSVYDVVGRSMQNVAFQALDQPEKFWRYSLAASLVVMVASLGLLAVVTGRLFGWSYAPLALLFFLAHPVTASTSYFTLGNETFCLLLGALLFFAGIKGLRSSIWWSLAAGVVAALCYLNKLNYAMWGLALGLGYVAAILCDRASWKIRARNLLVYGVAVVAVTLVVTEVWLGHKSGFRMLLLHFGVAAKTGHYGLGGSGAIVDPVAALQSAISFLSESLPYTALLVVVVVVPWIDGFRRSSSAVVRPLGDWPNLVFLSAAVLLPLAAAFKHYQLHYTLAAALPAVFLGGLMWTSWARWGRAALAGLVLVSFILNSSAVLSEFHDKHRYQVEDRDTAQLIRELPRERGELIAWGFRAPVPEYLDSFVFEIFPDQACRGLLPARHPEAAVAEIFTGFRPEAPGRLVEASGPTRYLVLYQGERRGMNRSISHRLAQAKAVVGNPHRVVLENQRWMVLEFDPPLPPSL